ncbi:MAG: hypothetical protein ACP5O6_13160 [Candidatus Baltobacteraceae bacterium]
MTSRASRRLQSAKLPDCRPGRGRAVLRLPEAVPDASSNGLARFSDALSLLTVLYGAHSANELLVAGDEAVTLGYVPKILRDACETLDRASTDTR